MSRCSQVHTNSSLSSLRTALSCDQCAGTLTFAPVPDKQQRSLSLEGVRCILACWCHQLTSGYNTHLLLKHRSIHRPPSLPLILQSYLAPTHIQPLSWLERREERIRMDRYTENKPLPHSLPVILFWSVTSPTYMTAVCCLLHIGHEAYRQGTLSSALPTPRKEICSSSVPFFPTQCKVQPIVNDWLAYEGMEDCYQHSLMGTGNTKPSIDGKHEETFCFREFPGLKLVVQQELAHVCLLSLVLEEGGKVLGFFFLTSFKQKNESESWGEMLIFRIFGPKTLTNYKSLYIQNI